VEAARTSASDGPRWRLYAAIVLIIIAAIFILQNSAEVTVDFLFAEITAPLIFALALAALLGLLIGLLIGRTGRLSKLERD
jgi:lipopolysaccharide assembly protein A